MLEAIKKCNELDISVIDIAKGAVIAAFDLGMTFTISETRRTYQRQCSLLSQGRTWNDIMRNDFKGGFRLNQQEMKDMKKIYDEGKNLSGPVVTYTLRSEHVKGLAMDIYPINTSYAELAMFFMKWGIVEPYMDDKPHFSLAKAHPLSKEQSMMLQRMIARRKERERV